MFSYATPGSRCTGQVGLWLTRGGVVNSPKEAEDDEHADDKDEIDDPPGADNVAVAD